MEEKYGIHSAGLEETEVLTPSRIIISTSDNKCETYGYSFTTLIKGRFAEFRETHNYVKTFL
jgi:hypothetical protein